MLMMTSPSTGKSEDLRAIFLDRDGVLNADSEEFIKSPDELHLLPGVPESLARLSEAGYALIVVTNQSGVGRGLVSEEDLAAIHDRLRLAIEAEGGRLTAVYYCPHHPDDRCVCRKPSPEMVRRAAREHHLDLQASFFVGDKPRDISCGAEAGCKTILVLSGLEKEYDPSRFPHKPDLVFQALPEAAEWILKQDR